MRWNRRERAVGEWAALAVFAAGWVVVGRPGAAARVEPGMTPADVAAALGSPGRTHPTKFAFRSIQIRPQADAAGWARQQAWVDEFFRKNSHFYQQYRLPFETVEVEFRGVQGEEQIQNLESYPSFGWIDWNWPLAGWACGAAVVGLAAAEATRRRRRTAPAGEGANP